MTDITEEIILFLKTEKGADAIGKKIQDSILVLQNSRIAHDVDPSFPTHLDAFRNKLLSKKIIVPKDGLLIFDVEYPFPDPSTAAAIVLGCNADGLKEWKTRDGKTLGDLAAG